jgi:hypothetical protein
MTPHRFTAELLKTFPVSFERCYGVSSERGAAMQTTKTRFDQVPIKVAERALRLQTGGPQTVARGNPARRNPVPTGVRRRRIRRGYLLGLVQSEIN